MTEMQNVMSIPTLDEQRKGEEQNQAREARRAEKKARRLAEEARNEQLRRSVNRMTDTAR